MKKTSINVTGMPQKMAVAIRKLAAVETLGKANQMCIRLIAEALEARQRKGAKRSA